MILNLTFRSPAIRILFRGGSGEKVSPLKAKLRERFIEFVNDIISKQYGVTKE
jgi:hypothetical protein